MTEKDPIPQIEDKRPKIAGVLPKNAQALVLAGIAFLMVLVILFSGHNTPKTRPIPSPASALVEPDQLRIQDYRAHLDAQTRQLAAEEADLAQTKQALRANTLAPDAPPPRPAGTAYAQPLPADRQPPEKTWMELDREKRDYESLFASNVALTYRTAASPAPAAPLAGLASIGTSTPSSATPQTAASGAQAGRSLSDPPVPPGTPEYRLFEGTILETVLTNRLDSSFSGPVNCMVTTNVYSPEGAKLLIPQGTRVLGEVKKLESSGDQRLAIFFHRLIMPDGFSVSLDQFKGLDQIGETGLRDQVNHHYIQIFGVSLAIGAFAGLAQANTRYSLDESAAEAYPQGVSNSLSQSALHILDRYLNVLPTFTIREGYRVKVYLSQDLMLPAYGGHPARNNL